MDVVLDALRTPDVPWLIAAGYLAGSIPFGLLLALLVGGKDVRKAGSGNIGATNVARVVGKKLGVVTLVLDALKGFIPVTIAARMMADTAPGRTAIGLVALAALCGHCFPIWLKLRGGKGVATGLGVLLASLPWAAGIGLLGFALTFAITRLVSLGSLVGALFVVAGIVALRPVDATLLPYAACAVVVLVKHHANIRRLLTKTELKV
jgi:acyl phosphate:glycerol-3-phosphate acyltransferase